MGWPKLTGIMPVGNVIRTHYPFLESAVAALSLVDRLIIADGESDDGTYEFCECLADSYPQVEVIVTPHTQSVCWETIDRSVEQMYRMVDDGWVYVVQADEFISPQDYFDIRVALTRAHAEGYNSIRQEQKGFMWNYVPHETYHYRTVRFLRAGLDVRSGAGADNWMLAGHEHSVEGYTTNNVPPELEIPTPFWNFPFAIPEAARVRYGHHVAFYNTGDTGCRANLHEFWQTKEVPTMVTDEARQILPPVFLGLAGLQRYEVRPEVFDADKWI